MPRDAKIYVAGHRGLVGSAICRKLEQEGFTHIIRYSSKDLDLRDQSAVNAFFESERPEYVFLGAAKVGGIFANYTYPAEFIYDNITIGTNIIHAAYKTGVKKLLFLGSACIYPRDCPQPIKEEYLLTGLLEKTNDAYALAKIAGLEMCRHYKRQYGVNFISCMPTNLFGVGDNFHPENSHALPALIRKCVEAKEKNLPYITLWGTGKPTREFLFVDDLADACLFLMENYDGEETINVGTESDISIAEVASLIKSLVGYEGEIRCDTSRPDGMPKRLLDISKIRNLGWQPNTDLKEGLKTTIDWYRANVNK
ncbi:MAG: GDP-fucose synthetase [Chlamydiae bacterium RIFCSPHIGHO2_12_FULL_49_11]|nr:MAG: GDP-fucose synthetase [Chlamydiae bacterium RIFCSPHIGHO2_12_FULL_49_11]